MSSKSLKEKAIDIKGKKYVLVSDRVQYFNETYPNGSITTELVSDPSNDYIIIKAIVIPDADSIRCFTGYSQAVIGDGMVNKTAALENAETSAVGRALGFMGIGVIESIASADEMHKVRVNTAPTGHTTTTDRYITAKQVTLLINKVKWTYNSWGEYPEADEVLNLLSTILGKEVNKVKMSEMDKAISDIEWWAKSAKRESIDPAPEVKHIEDNAIDIDLEEDISKLMEKIPY